MMRHPVRAALALSILSLAACDLSRIGLGGSDPGLIAPTNIDPAPDSTGIIKFDAFQVLVAREGDTISTMAERVTVDEVVLARYNGLPLNYKLQPGERLALPNDAQVAAVEQGWTPEVVTGVLDDLPDAPQPPAPTEAPGTQLVRHVVEPGETAYSIARLYRVAVTALASWNGLDKDLSVVEGRSLIIPPQPEQNTTVASLDPEIPDVAPPTTQPGEGTPLPPPPSAATPLPENTPKPAEPLTGPDLSQDTITPALQGFAMPVQGEVIKPYSPAAGPRKNEGIDFQTAKGASVSAAADGEVALVSRSLGGLGTIVLIRHRDDLMTVYGRVDGVSVNKGDQVTRGQVIGTVADSSPPVFHFEVRRGTESVDPKPYL